MIPHTAKPVKVKGEAKVQVTTKKGKSLVLNCNWLVYRGGVAAYEAGVLIQDAFPTLAADEREFLMSGITKEEWESIFGKEPE